MSKIRVADYIARRLKIEGVQHVFLLSGGGMMHLLDALGDADAPKIISQHHEQCCGFAADANARISGEFGVCYGTSGPGASNLVTSVVNSWQDSIPVLFITGQSKLSQTIENSKIKGLRQFGTFEVDIVPIVKSITKFAHFLSKANEIEVVMDRAIQELKTGRPGPVLIDIPVDLQGALIEIPLLKQKMILNSNFEKPSESQIEKLFLKLQQFQRPLLLVGHGVRASRAEKLLRQFVERLQLPTVITPMASDLLEFEHPNLVGRPGVKGDRAGNITVQNSDCLLSLGCSLHAMTTGYELDQFAPHAHKIQIEIDLAVQAREAVGVHEKYTWLVEDFLTAGLQYLEKNPNFALSIVDWSRHCQMVKKELDPQFEPTKSKTDIMSYYEVIDYLNQVTADGDIVIADAGLPFYLLGHAYKIKKGQRLIIPGALGQMGYALPAATGAAAADEKSNIFVLIGDGSFQTNIHELAVYKQTRANIKVILVNNNGYVSIRNTQVNYFHSRLLGTDPEHGVSFPDHRILSQAYDLPYFSAQTRDELGNMSKSFLSQKGPAILEVFVSKEQEVIPSVQSQKLPDGRMLSKPIQDMYPYMSEERLKKYYLR